VRKDGSKAQPQSLHSEIITYGTTYPKFFSTHVHIYQNAYYQIRIPPRKHTFVLSYSRERRTCGRIRTRKPSSPAFPLRKAMRQNLGSWLAE
jgi:hypothetical protein